MRIAFAGTPAPAVETLTALLESHHTIEFVITRPDAPTGRGKVMTASAVAQRAEVAGIECLKPLSLRDEAHRFSEVDAVVVVAYGAMVPAELLHVPKHGWLNIHYSLLPALRGAAPVQWAIKNGEDTTGVTIFSIDEGLDTGPIFAQRSVEISSQETADELLHRLSIEGGQLIVEVLDGIETGGLQPKAQPSLGISHAPKISSEDARIIWSQNSVDITHHIHAMATKPGAWTMCDDERIKIGDTRAITAEQQEVLGQTRLTPGQVKVVGNHVYVGTADNAIEVTLVQRPGKTMSSALLWATNLSLQPVVLV